MAANANPIFSRLGDVSTDGTTGMPTVLTTVSTLPYSGAGTNTNLIFTADATNGGYVERIRLKPIGTNIASVARFFINNGSTPGTAGNNAFFGEVSLPATTISAVAALPEIDYPVGFALPAGFRIYWCLGTTVAAGWAPLAIGGKY